MLFIKIIKHQLLILVMLFAKVVIFINTLALLKISQQDTHTHTCPYKSALKHSFEEVRTNQNVLTLLVEYVFWHVHKHTHSTAWRHLVKH